MVHMEAGPNKLLRIRKAEPLDGYRLRLVLTDGHKVEREVRGLLTGPVFEPVLDEDVFRRLRVRDGTVVWPNGADLCADVLIWGGPPPRDHRKPPETLAIHSNEALTA